MPALVLKGQGWQVPRMQKESSVERKLPWLGQWPVVSDRQTVAMLELGKLPCATLLPSSLPPSVMLPDGHTQPEPESKGAENALHTAQPPTAQSREEKDRERTKV